MEDLIDGHLTFEAVTGSVRVAVQSFFLEDQSEPDDHQFVWAYRVKIANEGPESIQLLSRHWIITDSSGSIGEVRGEGVIGEQPVIAPGDFFTYTSGTPLATPSGFMQGSYQMRGASGGVMDVAVPTFSLDSPYCDTLIH